MNVTEGEARQLMDNARGGSDAFWFSHDSWSCPCGYNTPFRQALCSKCQRSIRPPMDERPDEPRTTPKPPEVEPARSGILPTPSGGRSAACTGLTARWCPVHGDCTCRNPADHDDFGPSDMSAPDCPLHGDSSDHAEQPALLAEFTLPGCSSKKNNPQVSWPAIAKLGLRLAPKRPVRGLKDWLVLVRANATRGNLKGVIGMLSQGLKFYPAIQPSAKYQKFAKAARQYLNTRVDIRRPLVPPGETLVVDALFFLPVGRAGTRDEPGLLEALFDVIEDNGIIGNDYWLKIGPNCDRIWPPKGQSKAAKAARAAWVPRAEVKIYSGEPRKHGGAAP